METEPTNTKRWQAIIEFDTTGPADAQVAECLERASATLSADGAEAVTLRSCGELRPLRIPAMAGGGVNESYAGGGG